jgi:site-specific DNA recombinase
VPAIRIVWVCRKVGRIAGDTATIFATQLPRTGQDRAVSAHQERAGKLKHNQSRWYAREPRATVSSELQHPREKRRLLNFVLSNCTWEDGEVVATFREPFDMLAETTTAAARLETDETTNSAKSGIWLGN